MLLIGMAICMSGVVLIENPGSSMLFLHDRMQWLLQQLEKAGMVVPLLQITHINLYFLPLG